jgi:hypothetical protein
VPPIVRPLSDVNALSLYREEESREEADARNALGLGVDDRQAGKTSGQHAELASNERMEVDSAESSLPSNPVVPEPGQMQRATPQAEQLPKAFIKFSNHPPTTTVSAAPSEDPIPAVQAPKAPVSKIEPSPMVVTAAMDEDEDDEDVPGINMDSDSD